MSRDAHGRFLKGTTGNPKGRPTKLSMIESADVGLFKNTMVEVDSVRGRKRILTREGAIQERLYASAMKGNVQAQVFLTRRFDADTVAFAEAGALLHKIYKTVRAEDRPPTDDEAAAIHMLRMRLNEIPKPDLKVKKQRPSRAKQPPTPATDHPHSAEDRSGTAPPPKAAKPSK